MTLRFGGGFILKAIKMKRILLSLAFLAVTGGFAQTSIQLTHYEGSVVVAANGTINAVTTAQGNTKVTLDVKNTSNSQKSYNAKRYDVQLNAAGGSTAVAYFCFAGTCYGDNVFVSPSPLTLNGGQSASQLQGQYQMLVADLDEANAVGLSIVKYTFQNTSQASDSIQITIRYNAPQSIQSANSIVSAFDLSPNPVHDAAILKISSKTNAEGLLVIHNALGGIVHERSVQLTEGKNKVELNTEQFSSGIYFASLKFGHSAVTRKFVVR
jgi:hypothetical protein